MNGDGWTDFLTLTAKAVFLFPEDCWVFLL